MKGQSSQGHSHTHVPKTNGFRITSYIHTYMGNVMNTLSTYITNRSFNYHFDYNQLHELNYDYKGTLMWFINNYTFLNPNYKF
jgi:hypothetical protein